MIIYGSRTTPLVRKPTSGECSDCGAENSIDLTLYQKYLYFIGIPISPDGKMPLTECSNCRKVSELGEFSPALLQEYEKIKQKTKTPLWTFFGAALFIILLGLFLFFKIC